MIKATARAIRELLDGQRVLALAVNVDSQPYAGLLPFAVLPEYAGVLIHASRLSRHSQGLGEGGTVCVLLHEQLGPDSDPLQLKRASLDCRVHAIERGSEDWEHGRAAFLERFPKSRITFRLGDFTLYRLLFQQGLYVGGFGRAVEIEPKDVAKIATLV